MKTHAKGKTSYLAVAIGERPVILLTLSLQSLLKHLLKVEGECSSRVTVSPHDSYLADCITMKEEQTWNNDDDTDTDGE